MGKPSLILCHNDQLEGKKCNQTGGCCLSRCQMTSGTDFLFLLTYCFLDHLTHFTDCFQPCGHSPGCQGWCPLFLLLRLTHHPLPATWRTSPHPPSECRAHCCRHGNARRWETEAHHMPGHTHTHPIRELWPGCSEARRAVHPGTLQIATNPGQIGPINNEKSQFHRFA